MQRLYRSRHERVIAGVCGGIAEYFRVDVTLIRLLWAVAVFAGGTGILAYILAILIIPEEPYGYTHNGHWANPSDTGAGAGQGGPAGPAGPNPPSGEAPAGQAPSNQAPPSAAGHHHNAARWPASTGSPAAVFGWVLLGLGFLFLVHNLVPWFAWGRFWPGLLVLAGIFIVLSTLRGDRR